MLLLRRLKSSRPAREGSQRTYHRQKSPRYWIRRERSQRVRLWVARNIFKTRDWARSRWESASIFVEILKTVAGQLLFAVVLVIGLEVLERVLLVRLGTLVHPFAGLPGTDTTGALGKAFGSLQLDTTVYADILVTMVQVAGVFLGLYFAAVSIVASTIYARVHGDVRALLLREKVGNLYIRTVALLGVTATILLAAYALGYSPGMLNLALVTVLGGLSILSFVVLGSRVFYFFDPVPLVDYVGQDLAREIRAVTPEGFRWQDQSFQNYHQRQAENLLKTYGNIVHLATREDHLRSETLRQLATRALSLLQFYAQNKSRIPSDSRWFKRTNRHKDWLTSNAAELEIALNTGTSLLPEQVPDPNWFESQVEKLLARIVTVLLEREELRSAVEVYDGVRRTSYFLGERLALDEALRLFRSLKEATNKHVSETASSTETTPGQDERLSLMLGLVDVQGAAFINILLGFSERLRATTAESFGGAVSRIAWDRPGSVYAAGFPRAVVERLEELQEGLKTERAVEGHAVTPLWYQQQLAALGFARLLSEAAEKLVAELESTFADEVESLVSEGRHFHATQTIDRGVEACSKFAFHLGEFKACFERLGELRRVEDIPWPTLEWEKLGDRVGAVKERLVCALAECLPKLADVPRSEDLPDYFGHAYTLLAKESYFAMAKGDEGLFTKIFPPLFAACFSAHERLSEQLRDRDGTTTVMYSTEPLADLLELSGHAIIYSELDDKGYWRVTKALWDHYVSHYPKPSVVLDFLSEVVGKRELLFVAITPRDLVRTSWKQDLERRLEERGLVDDVLGGNPYREEDADKHASKLIRVLTRGRYMVQDPHDVFLAVYSSGRPEFSGLELPHKAKSLVEELAEEPDEGSHREKDDD